MTTGARSSEPSLRPAAPRSIAGGFLVLGGGELLARVVAFGVSVYLSRTLGAEGFGIISFSLAVMLYLQRTVGLELEGLGVHEAIDPKDGRAAVTGLLLIRFILAVMMLLATAIAGRWFLPETDARVLTLSAASLLALSINVRWVHLVRRHNEAPAIARIVSELLAAGMVVLWVAGPADLLVVPLALVAAEVVAAALLYGKLEAPRLASSIHQAWQAARPIVRRAVPLVLYALLGLITFNVDLLMVRVIWGSTEAGYYAAAYALTSLLISLGIAYYANIIPLFARVRNDTTSVAALYKRTVMPAFAVVLPTVVGGMIVGPVLLTTTFGHAYAPSVAPLRPLMVAAGLTVLRLVQLAVLVTTDRRGQALVMNVMGATLNIGLNLLLIPPFGIIGAALSTLTTDVVRMGIAAFFLNQAGVAALRARWIWRWVVATAVMAGPVWLLRESGPWLSIPAGVAVFGATAFALGALRREGWSFTMVE